MVKLKEELSFERVVVTIILASILLVIQLVVYRDFDPRFLWGAVAGVLLSALGDGFVKGWQESKCEAIKRDNVSVSQIHSEHRD